MTQQSKGISHHMVSDFNKMIICWMMSQQDEILDAFGVDLTIVRRFRRLPIGVLNTNVGMLAEINQKNLSRILELSEQNHYDDKLMELGIRCGARYPLLNYYLGITRKSFNERLHDFGYPLMPSGRIGVMTRTQEYEVIDRWREIRSRYPDQFMALCKLAESIDISLSRIWATFGPNGVGSDRFALHLALNNRVYTRDAKF